MPHLSQIHHVGIACRDIESVRSWVHQTHETLSDSGPVWDPLQEAELCLIEIAGGAIELVAGPMVEQLVKRGHNLYHLCYGVSSIGDATEQLIQQGSRLVSGPTPAVLFEGRRVAFLLSPLGLIELLED